MGNYRHQKQDDIQTSGPGRYERRRRFSHGQAEYCIDRAKRAGDFEKGYSANVAAEPGMVRNGGEPQNHIVKNHRSVQRPSSSRHQFHSCNFAPLPRSGWSANPFRGLAKFAALPYAAPTEPKYLAANVPVPPCNARSACSREFDHPLLCELLRSHPTGRQKKISDCGSARRSTTSSEASEPGTLSFLTDGSSYRQSKYNCA